MTERAGAPTSGQPHSGPNPGPDPGLDSGHTPAPNAGPNCGPNPGPNSGAGLGISLVLAGAASTQAGAGVGVLALPALGPAGVVGMRQLVATCVLLPIARPPIRRLTWSQWWPVLLLAASLASMNLLIYSAFARIGLGLAVTLEFLGPLVLGIVGSRSRIDLLVAIAAGIGVYVLVLPGPSSNVLGIAFGLAAGACWAAYILASRIAGKRLPGIQATALAMGLSTAVYLPLLVVLASRAAAGEIGWQPFAFAAAAGVLSSAIPYALDIIALRRLTAPVFGVLMSIHPVFAAFAGLVVLGQVLDAHEWIGILIVVLANAVGVWSRRPRPPAPRD